MHARGHGEELKLREGGVAWQEVDGETVLLDLEHSRYLGVNAAGTLIWRALAVGTTRGELIAQLQREFGIPEAQAGGDVDSFVADCTNRNLLQ
jgi:hypothetical protein